MKKGNSLYLLVLGCFLLPVGILIQNPYLLYSSIIINIVAIIQSFKEKKENN